MVHLSCLFDLIFCSSLYQKFNNDKMVLLEAAQLKLRKASHFVQDRIKTSELNHWNHVSVDNSRLCSSNDGSPCLGWWHLQHGCHQTGRECWADKRASWDHSWVQNHHWNSEQSHARAAKNCKNAIEECKRTTETLNTTYQRAGRSHSWVQRHHRSSQLNKPGAGCCNWKSEGWRPGFVQWWGKVHVFQAAKGSQISAKKFSRSTPMRFVFQTKKNLIGSFAQYSRAEHTRLHSFALSWIYFQDSCKFFSVLILILNLSSPYYPVLMAGKKKSPTMHYALIFFQTPLHFMLSWK